MSEAQIWDALWRNLQRSCGPIQERTAQGRRKLRALSSDRDHGFKLQRAFGGRLGHAETILPNATILATANFVHGRERHDGAADEPG